jgi:hypothetical protein
MLFVVIPNFNGAQFLQACIQSLLNNIKPEQIIVVDNGSTDSSIQILNGNFPDIVCLKQNTNLGFAGGVNAGIRYALDNAGEYVILLNNDAIVDGKWVSKLVEELNDNPKIGIATSKIISTSEPAFLDSTGESFSTWGLPFPRGRERIDLDKYDNESDRFIFGASGGASIYRIKMLQQIGIFDEDFFAYYEDVDLSFRAQLAGWQVAYVPEAVVYHQIGGTSSKMRGFTTYHTFKNLPWLLIKNMPLSLLILSIPRFLIAYCLLFLGSVRNKRVWYALKGAGVSLLLLPKKLFQRFKIQHKRTVSAKYISSIIYHGLPPSYRTLYKIFHPFKKGGGSL